MKKENIINTASLKDQVYDYLREEIRSKSLKPGDTINMDATSRKLGISKTPLRDALLQLEMEGFVSIEARRGIYVNKLALDEIREYYQVIGALESSAISTSFNRIKSSHVEKMNKLNQAMETALKKDNFEKFYEKNLEFHAIYLDLCGNTWLNQIVNNLKKRLYDFIPQDHWIKEWEESSIKEHEDLITAFDRKDCKEAMKLIS